MKDQMSFVFGTKEWMCKKNAKKNRHWKADWQVRQSTFFYFHLLLLYLRFNFPLCLLPFLLLIVTVQIFIRRKSWQIFALVECYTVQTGSWLLTFWKNLSVLSSRVKQ